MAEIVEVEISMIDVGAHEQRLGVNDEAINDLTCSIRRIGVLVPLVVRPHGDRFVLVAGHRRLRAAKLCGCKKVPVLCKEAGVGEGAEIAFAENFFRADLSAVEQAGAIKDVISTGALTIEQIAVGFHRTQDWVRRQLSILDWPADVLGALHSGTISVSAASNIALITEDTYRGFLVKNAVENGATARTTAAWLQAFRAMAPVDAALNAEPVASGLPSTPAVPQAPCICCGNVFRTDELSHVPVCVGCIRVIRGVGESR